MRVLVMGARAVGGYWRVLDLPPDAVEMAVSLIRGLPAGIGTSMQLDFERRRRVELEDITGAAVRWAGGWEWPLPSPTSPTRS